MPEVETVLFRRNVQKIYEIWQQDSKLSELAAIFFFVNDENDDSSIQSRKGENVQHWLFGVEFKSVIFILTQNQFLILTSSAKINFLKPLIINKNFSPEVVLLTRNKKDESENYNKLIDAITSSGNGSTVGVFFTDKPTCKFISDFDSLISAKFTKEGFDLLQSQAMLKKYSVEIENIKNASKINSEVYKLSKNLLYKSIEEKNEIRNHDLSNELTNYIQSSQFEEKHGDMAGHYDFSHPPLISSDGKSTGILNNDFKSSKKPIFLNSISISISARYKYFFSTMSRTIFVNPSPSKEKNYNFALELINHISLNLMKPGKTLKYVSEQAIQFVENRNPELRKNLIENFGFPAGIIFNDKKMQINSLNDVIIDDNCCFVICVMFENIQAADVEKSSMKEYSISIADTIFISNNGNEVLTTNKKELPYVKMMVTIDKDEEISSDENDENFDIDELAKKMGIDNLKNNEGRNRRFNENLNKIQIVAKDQVDIKHSLYENAHEKLMKMNPMGEDKLDYSVINSYAHVSSMPSIKIIRSKEIFVDSTNQTVIFFVFGQSYPVHISKIKNLNLSNSFNGNHIQLRINLNCPMSLYKASEDQMSCYIKELHFKANDFKSGNETSTPSTFLKSIVDDIKTLQKDAKKPKNPKSNELLELKDFKLIPFDDCKKIQLHNVFLRPFLTNKKSVGSLEAFKNGFLFVKKTGERVMFPYSSIKYSIYQPCSNQNMIIALHFRLTNSISFNNKKSDDIQFFAEAGELSENLEAPSSKRSRYDDDNHEEEMQSQLRKRLRASFITFCKEVEDKTNGIVNFERPSSEESFMAKTNKYSEVFLSENYMFSIIEWPSFILDAKDIELIYVERDIESLQTCDIAIILKDYTKKVINVSTVERKDLDNFKFWLNNHKIAIFSGIQILNWPRIMTTILEDPHGFAENGNWKFLSLESSSDEESSKAEESNESTEDESDAKDDITSDESESSDEESSGDESDEESEEEDDSEDEDY